VVKCILVFAEEAALEAVNSLTGSFIGDQQINLQIEENIPQVGANVRRGLDRSDGCVGAQPYIGKDK
jgi:hypothetical protein